MEERTRMAAFDGDVMDTWKRVEVLRLLLLLLQTNQYNAHQAEAPSFWITYIL